MAFEDLFTETAPTDAILQQLGVPVGVPAAPPMAPAMPTVAASPMPAAAPAPAKPGFDWHALLNLAGPAAGMFAGNPNAQAAFANRWRVLEEQDRQNAVRQSLLDERKKSAGAEYALKGLSQLSGVDDPTQWVQLRNLLADSAPDPNAAEHFRAMPYPEERRSQAKLKAINDELGKLRASGIDPSDPDLAQHVVRLKDGSQVSFGDAVALTATAFDPSGNPLRAPKKQDVAASTDYGRFLARYAKDKGKSSVDQLSAADELDARKQYGQADDAGRTIAPGGVDAQFSDLLDLWKETHPGQTPTAKIRTDLRTQANRVNDKPQLLGGMNTLYTQSDPKSIAAAIMRGEREPETGNLGRPISAAVDSELAKAGFNKAAAVTDWKATQRHIATMNNGQQLRLNQSINALPDLLDSVDALAAQWQGGRFPLLNKANLALAKNGVYGNEAATIANQLTTQIADVTADLGNVYMGGNSPTDHALSLAGTALQGDWDAKVLRDMVTLARKNVTIRRNSIANTGVAGASPGNPYYKAPDVDAGGGGSKVRVLSITPVK
jgi:hypothetical protein